MGRTRTHHHTTGTGNYNECRRDESKDTALEAVRLSELQPAALGATRTRPAGREASLSELRPNQARSNKATADYTNAPLPHHRDLTRQNSSRFDVRAGSSAVFKLYFKLLMCEARFSTLSTLSTIRRTAFPQQSADLHAFYFQSEVARYSMQDEWRSVEKPQVDGIKNQTSAGQSLIKEQAPRSRF